ncbi:N-acetylmuramidase domain-containing protein [Algoriphagus persicinus]|uniref:N-acetylmuramidase domain-containing protein n=1 Tax=Algoriphagus persicinus TaxID=3108754 RepID=UPI002B368B49|nr:MULTISPECIES: N-acetylmuramidase domain-containing protein [unclassified Algoriphagus]MEB2780052.1 N-acetylmuramidase domain-containing protein [Algoriphagus sp. C2-6-M1]MEB2785607.1 N-acetylmuramidase domain-containing protein [Algoriphagus sp. E1-3-M2]
MKNQLEVDGEVGIKMWTLLFDKTKPADVFGRYILNNGCLAHLQRKNWAKYAECYNASGYAQNKYDVKMAKAYVKFSTQR